MDDLKTALVEGAATLGVSLDTVAVDRFRLYLHDLLIWNQTRNLTAIREPAAVIARHFLDSLTCVAAYDFNTGRPVIDVGSGAGFPGIALKIAFPGMPLALLDASMKKVQFLQHICTALGFSDVDISHGRAEEYGQSGAYRQKFHLVIARSVAALPILAELCLPLATLGGYFIAQKNLDAGGEIAGAAGAIERLGGGEPELLEVTVPGTELRRALIRIRKERSTPSTYPRRPGIPASHPIGESTPERRPRRQRSKFTR